MSFETKPLIESIVVEQYLNVIFLIDIVRKITIPIKIQGTGRYIKKFKPLAKRYLLGWFWIDLYAFIPFALLKFRSRREDGGFNE